MLTRDGERVLEVLLIAAGLALAVVFRDDLPGQNPSDSPGPADARSPLTQEKVPKSSIQGLDRSGATPTHVTIGPIEQALAELEQLTSRC